MNVQQVQGSFLQSGYLIVKNFCEPETAHLLAQRLEDLRNNQLDKTGQYFRDNTIPQAFSCHGHLDFALNFWKEKIGELMGTGPIIPINSYARIYEPGAKLVPHLDRPELELSATICLKPDRVPWKFGVVDLAGNTVTVEQEAGDAFFYQGKLLHWREGAFQGNSHSQLFLHYQKADSKGVTGPLPFVTLNTNQVDPTELFSEVMKLKEHFSPSLIYSREGTVHQPGFRNSLSLNQEKIPPLTRKLEELVIEEMPKITSRLGLDTFKVGKSEINCVSFGDGSFFSSHADATPKGNPRRRVSWVYYFHREPKSFTGGELVLSPPTGKEVQVSPQPGLLVTFRSDTVHKVREVAVSSREFADSRLTITGFISERESGNTALTGARRVWRKLPVPDSMRSLLYKMRKKFRKSRGKAKAG